MKFAERGECDLNRKWMSNHCTRACDSCGEVLRSEEPTPYSDCFNSFGDDTCRKWGSNVRCNINPQWMLHICYKQCSKCDEVISKIDFLVFQ